ncbi:ATP-dependent DNA ligase [Paenibacillus woosongensis]|uniref:SPBc2 prophage-derived DNA ligase-like protein LigB n=1 Tax=Paenibacillus woosongensis TaxID=307580 RepID=A0ABQ4MZ09_9BACL|nr:ATP-dependent DNA ligase [Paenibacillus woosongensis]GIP61115.1 SPBc2 prophage-derived DNA ligase-like protein LigB [Paenibacillus woosongensis]
MFISPMLLATAPGPFSDPRYIFEPKIDGHRLIFSQQDGAVRLYTRHANDCTPQYPEIAGALFEHDIVLDGEVACADPASGVSDFEAIMSRFQAKRADKIARLSVTLPACFAVFDILRYKGEDLRRLPLIERKAILADIAFPNANIGVVPFVECAGEALFAQIKARGMEGVVGKRRDGVYETGRRSDSWRKLINWTHAEVYITGYKKAEFGWLAGIADDRGKIRPAGIIQLGVTPTDKKAFFGVVKPLITGEDREFIYINPQIRAKVKMRNWTKAGFLRNPVFMNFIF